MKECFKCNEIKPLDLFYKHKQMSDGFFNKCKECAKKEAKERHYEKYKDTNFVEAERKRARDKYHRLNYKEKQKKWDENRPWKKNYIYKNIRRKFNIKPGYEFHHWNYNIDFLQDGFILDIFSHRQLHTNLIFIPEERIFKTLENVVLDSKKKHQEFMSSLNLDFEII